MSYRQVQKRISTVIEVGYDEDFWGRTYDVINLAAIVINLSVSVAMTFDAAMERCGAALQVIEAITLAFFLVD